MLIIKYTADIFHRLGYEKEMNKSRIIRKRCVALYMKMYDGGLGCERIARLCGYDRNSVRNRIILNFKILSSGNAHFDAAKSINLYKKAIVNG